MNGENLIYCGPNVYALGLQNAQVFVNGLPPYVSRAAEQIPEIKLLIVPVDELYTMRGKIKRSGSYESNLYAIIQKKASVLRKGKTVNS